ncbi:MAG: WYL domain-containing protein [Mariniphaga sp.]
MKNYERLIKLEEVLSDPKGNRTRKEWIDLYENEYFLSARTFREDLKQYNLALNEKYNIDRGVGQRIIVDYVIKQNDRYRVLKDPQGNPYTLFNPVMSLKTEDWHMLANLFAFSSHIIDDGLANRLRALIAFMSAEEDSGVPWKPVSLIKDGIFAGRDNYSIILSSIQKRQLIYAHHHKIDQPGKSKKIRLLPLLLKEYSNGWISGWYLLAYEMNSNAPFRWPALNELRVYALDRLDKIIPIEEYYVPDPPKGFNPSDYFKDSLGVHRINLNKPYLAPERIVLRTVNGSWMYPYLKAYPIHSSQRVIKDDQLNKQLEIELKLEIDLELKSFLNKHSNDIQVIEPIQLRELILINH